jgi:hypothetical protein
LLLPCLLPAPPPSSSLSSCCSLFILRVLLQFLLHLLLLPRFLLLFNKAQISPIHQRTWPPLLPEDGRFDPTSCTSFDAS